MKLDRIVIKVNDYSKSFKFYHDILGLKLQTSWQREDSWGALFFCGQAILEILWYPEGDQADECNYIPQFSKTDIFFTVSNVDTLYNSLKSYDEYEITSPQDFSWGYRVFTITDPDKVKIVFAQPI